MFTEDQVNEILTGAFEQIKSQVIENSINQLEWDIKSRLSEEIKTVVHVFVTEEVMPELRQELILKKSEIVKAGVLAAEDMAQQLASAMAAKFSENLGTSYKRSEILKTLFS